MTDIAGTLADFATRFQRMHASLAAVEVGDVGGTATAPTPHISMSPLAMWAQLALIGVAAGAPAGEIAPTPALAEEMVRGVLRHPHPACVVGATAWLNAAVDRGSLTRLVEEMAQAGLWSGHGIPSFDELDGWTAGQTAGVVTQFPIGAEPDPFAHLSGDPDPGSAFVSGIAFSTSGRWASEVEVCPSGELAGPWGVSRVLRIGGADCGLAWDQVIGLLGVTVSRSGNGLFVMSVIADPDTREEAVTAAAMRTARRFATGERVLLRGEELPVGDGGWWRVSDSPLYRGGIIEQQHNASLIPAWTAADTYDLMAHGLGYWGVVHQGLLAQIGAPYDHASAAHLACARVDADGFATSAVTATEIVRGGWASALLADHRYTDQGVGPMPRFGGGGTLVELDYRHPFAAVVATASEHQGHFWQGLPLHVGWVAAADEPA